MIIPIYLTHPLGQKPTRPENRKLMKQPLHKLVHRERQTGKTYSPYQISIGGKRK